MSFILSVAKKPFMLSFVMLNVMLSVANKTFILSFVMLNAIMLIDCLGALQIYLMAMLV